MEAPLPRGIPEPRQHLVAGAHGAWNTTTCGALCGSRESRMANQSAQSPSAPTGVTLDQVLRFKERHADLLPAFRLLVETRSAQIARIAAAEERLQATQLFIQTCQRGAEEIASAMRPTWGKIAFGSLVPLFGAGLALHGADVGNLELYAGAALSFAGAAYQAIATVDGNREQLLRRPLAYVAHARINAGQLRSTRSIGVQGVLRRAR